MIILDEFNQNAICAENEVNIDAELLIGGFFAILTFLVGIFSWVFKKGYDKADSALIHAVSAKESAEEIKKANDKRDIELERRLLSIERSFSKINELMVSVGKLQTNDENIKNMMEKMEAHLLRIEQNQNVSRD